MTRTAFYALAGLAGYQAQQVSVTVSLPESAANLEYNTQQTFTCSWQGDEDLVNAGIEMSSEALQIKWYYQGDTIYTMEADEYTAYPSFGTKFFELGDGATSVTANVTEQFSSLTLNSVKLEDVGAYKCRVSLKAPKEIAGRQGYVSGNGEMSNVKVYATPSVSFSELNLMHDTRQTQYEAYLIANAPEVTTASANVTSNMTESIGMFSEPESVDGAIVEEILETEASVPVENSEAEVVEAPVTETAAESPEYLENSEPVESRKRRQAAEETAAPEMESTPELMSLASCVVAGAYPEPSNIKVYIGDALISDLDETMFVVSANGQLFDTQVSVSAAVNGPDHSGNAIRCEVNDAENMYTSESVSEPLDIKYLTTSVTISASEIVYETEKISFSCAANGNPAPVLTLVHLNDEAINAKINGSSSFTVESAARDGDYAFVCRASSSELEFSEFVMESEPVTVQVNYLVAPVIDVEGERADSDSEDNKFTIAKDAKFIITCEAEADPVAKYTWFKDGVDAGSNNALTVEKADWSNSGVYYCSASNEGPAPKKSSEVIISVQGECQIDGISVEVGKANAEGQQSVTLTCNIAAEVQPECSVNWIYTKTLFKGSKSNGNQLTLKNVNSIDNQLLLESSVTCQASNAFGAYKPASVLRGNKIAKQLDDQEGTSMWLYLGIGALLLVVIIIVVKKQKGKKEAPAEESEKMNA
jgi:hypothetical protein